MERKKLPPTILPKLGRGQHLKGRPPGVTNKVTRALAHLAQYRETGELPHEFLLRVSRGERIAHGVDDKGNQMYHQPTIEERIDCAKQAAPYFAPKLSTVEVIKGVSDDDLDQIIQQAALQAGLTVDTIKQIDDKGQEVFSVPEENT